MKNGLKLIILTATLCWSGNLFGQLPLGDVFEFVRIQWTDHGVRYGWGFSTNAELWAHDFPLAEENLYVGLQAATNFKISQDNKVFRFDDDEIFKYPFIYACEIGYLTLAESEVENLREYLLRGGFLMVDDFRWNAEWNNWMREIRRVLPDHKIQRLPLNHPIFHCFFDLSAEDIESPTPYLPVEFPPQYYAIFDENGRMMVLINFNNDVGDGWEIPEGTEEIKQFSTRSFKLGINYLIYSYTH